MRKSGLTTERQTDGDTSAHVELRFAAKNWGWGAHPAVQLVAHKILETA